MSCNTQIASTRRRAARLDLYIEQGTTFEIPIIYKQDGLPVDLTGVTAHAQLREKVSSLVPLVDLASPDNGLVITPAEGKIVMTMTAAQTQALKVYKGVWDMLLTFSDGTKVRILNGQFTVSRGVTR